MRAELTTSIKARYRGHILCLLRDAHYKRQSRLDDIMVWSLLQTLTGDTVGQDLTLTLLEELSDAEYILYQRDVNERTGDVRLRKIQLTNKGRRIVERIDTDEMVLITSE